jgi:hypothetical protein
MALLETYWPWIIFESWYYVRRPISLRRIVLFDVDFQLCSIQTSLNFQNLARIVQITSARFSSHFSLACTLRGMAPTPHAIMLRSQRMWSEVSFTSVGLGTLGVLQINLEPILLQECVPHSPSNSFLLIVMKLGQRVV